MGSRGGRTCWGVRRPEEAIRAFAGDDISGAKYYDFDNDFLLELDSAPRITRFTTTRHG
jgi:hypothetical protein